MTLIDVVFTIIYGVLSGLIATYIVRFIDKHKNDRHTR